MPIELSIIIKKENPLVRRTLWKFYNKKCFYCGNPLDFKNIKIDHLIAKNTPNTEVERIKIIASLPNSFNLDRVFCIIRKFNGRM